MARKLQACKRVNHGLQDTIMKHSLILAAALIAAAAPATAQELIINGGFETGDYTGWSANVAAGSNGGLTVIGNGANAPFSSNPTATNAGGGSFVSMTDQGGPGAYDLRQSFLVPLGATSVILTADHVATDWSGAGPIIDPIGLDYTGPANQHARVDLLVGTAALFSTAPADILATFYLGVDAGTPASWTTSWTNDITALVTPGQSYIIRFGQVDNQGFFNQGVDNVSVFAAGIPEPATWAMLITGFGLVGFAARRRRTAFA